VWFFQIGLISFLSVLTCSSRCQYFKWPEPIRWISQSSGGDLWCEKLSVFHGFLTRCDSKCTVVVVLHRFTVHTCFNT
jgi:hypothetical protein